MKQAITVSQLNAYVSDLLEGDSRLNPVMVRGELSGVKAYPSGHVYFTLKDAQAAVSCVLFRGYASKLAFKVENGLNVVVSARATVYQRDGRYQLLVTDMTPDGIGALYLAYEQLREKLKAEGLFDADRKKPLPLLPRSIGVVTSPAGAVIRDIIQVLTRRFYAINLKLYPVPVQGETAAAAIAKAIRFFNDHDLVDVLIVGRGGGSLEDLWPFNEEVVARAVAASHIPVVSAVGHETDHTICDFVADLRAPTPSAAAELVVPVRDEEILKIINGRNRMAQALNRRLEREKERLARLTEARVLKNPYEQLDRRRQDLDGQAAALHQALRGRLTAAEQRLSLLSGQLHALSPLRVLGRGYGLVASADTGKSIRSTALVKAGDRLDVTLIDGTMRCLVDQVMNRKGTRDCD